MFLQRPRLNGQLQPSPMGRAGQVFGDGFGEMGWHWGNAAGSLTRAGAGMCQLLFENRQREPL